MLQYLAPALQWLTGIYLFHELFEPHKAIDFGLIRLVLLVYGAEGAVVHLAVAFRSAGPRRPSGAVQCSAAGLWCTRRPKSCADKIRRRRLN